MERTPRDISLPSQSSAVTHLVLYDEHELRGRQLHESLPGLIPGVQVHRVHSREEVERVLQNGPVDVILASCAAGEGSELVERMRAWVHDIPVVVCEAAAQEEHAVAFIATAMKEKHPVLLSRLIQDVVEPHSAARAANGMHTSVSEPLDPQQIRSALLRVNHDINNPLSIISGNAQLLLELARAMGLDESLIQPMRDIDEACQRASQLLGGLVELAAQLEPPAQNTSS